MGGLKARPELNGLQGTIVEWEDGQSRWKVRMADGTGKMLTYLIGSTNVQIQVCSLLSLSHTYIIVVFKQIM